MKPREPAFLGSQCQGPDRAVHRGGKRDGAGRGHARLLFVLVFLGPHARGQVVDRVVERGPQVLGGVGPPRAPTLGAAASWLGALGNRAASAARRTPRSVRGKASGSPSARIAMISTVQGPTPASWPSWARASSQSPPGPRSIFPSASAATRPATVAWRALGPASSGPRPGCAGADKASARAIASERSGTGLRPGR